MNLTTCLRPMFLTIISPLLLSACEKASSPVAELTAQSESPVVVVDAADAVNQIADRYYATTLERVPETAYFSGVELAHHDGMEDNSPSAREADAVL